MVSWYDEVLCTCEGGGGGCLSGGDGGGGGEEEEQLGVPCVRSLLSFIANQLGNLLGVPEQFSAGLHKRRIEFNWTESSYYNFIEVNSVIFLQFIFIYEFFQFNIIKKSF